MIIRVTQGTGEGKTKIAAFDNALWDAGIANYNLIRLSSVIPDDSEIVVEKADMNAIEHGHKLYVVTAEGYESTPGRKAVAGLGWATAGHSKGKGIFVEHSGSDKEAVERYLRATIGDITSKRFGGQVNTEIMIVERECTGDVACAVIAAVFKSEGWS